MLVVPVLLSLRSIWKKYRAALTTCIGLMFWNIWGASEVPCRSACEQNGLRNGHSVSEI